MYFKILISHCSLLVYRNKLVFTPWANVLLPVLVISFSSFFADSFSCSIQTIRLSVNKSSHTSSFPVWMSFCVFLLPHCAGRTSSTTLNLAPDLKEENSYSLTFSDAVCRFSIDLWPFLTCKCWWNYFLCGFSSLWFSFFFIWFFFFSMLIMVNYTPIDVGIVNQKFLE